MTSYKKTAEDRKAERDPERRKLVSVTELAEYLGVPVQTIYEWNCKGTGPKVLKVGRYVRYRWQDIDRWLDASAQKGGTS